MLKILIIGSGAREHIIAEKFYTSNHPKKLYCWASSRNPGIMPLCTTYQVGKLTDNSAIITFAKQHQIDLAFIGPELPLSTGLADDLLAANIACIGPTKALAQIETSKGFTRDLLDKYKISSSPKYFRCHDLGEAKNILATLDNHYVIKADGLMGGKGVKLAGEHLNSQAAALNYCQEILSSNQCLVIEEKLIGEEFSLMSLVAGQQIIHLPAVQDHKRAFINDTGPNTGGMGTYSDKNHALPFLSAADIAYAQKINGQVAAALQAECSATYCGILYGSFMLTADGIKLIEYNARFGDPEALNLLTLLETDFIDLCLALNKQQLPTLAVKFAEAATVCKYLVPNGYPDDPETGQPITLGKLPESVAVYYGGVDQKDERLVMTGARALALVSKADSITEAAANIELAISMIQGDFFHRPDIGSRTLVNQRIQHINKLCHRDYALL